MGISLEDFMKKMYEKRSNGDWLEYGDNAKKLKWIDNVVKNIKDSSIKIKFKKPDKKKEALINKTSNFINEQNSFYPNDFCYIYIPENYNLKLNYKK